jgi:hypothetical protein
MIIKWAIIGGVVSLATGLYFSNVPFMTIVGVVAGIAFRKWILRTFWA